MSSDFLRAYTIPSLPKSDDDLEKIDKVEQMPTVEEKLPEEAEYTTNDISNHSRYIVPGKQSNLIEVPIIQDKLKRKHSIDQLPAQSGKSVLPMFVGRDPSYPEELNLLIHPLSCHLCKIEINSLKSAKAHYESKAHNRKINDWITKNCGENPPIVKRVAREGPTGPAALHCELCDLPLTSLTHAKSHYSGRKHRLVVNKTSNPSGTGYYNNEGKWVRTKANIPGRFGIGTDFVQPKIPDDGSGNKAAEKDGIETKSEPQLESGLCCVVCKISVTSAGQMSTHLSGAKHRKNLERASTSTTDVLPPSTEENSAQKETLSTDSILATINDEVNDSDLSMYRTPTGSYYCQICNISLSQIAPLKQHIQGKKHTKKALETKSNENKSI